jgi:hypothetical protein
MFPDPVIGSILLEDYQEVVAAGRPPYEFLGFSVDMEQVQLNVGAPEVSPDGNEATYQVNVPQGIRRLEARGRIGSRAHIEYKERFVQPSSLPYVFEAMSFVEGLEVEVKFPESFFVDGEYISSTATEATVSESKNPGLYSISLRNVVIPGQGLIVCWAKQ